MSKKADYTVERTRERYDRGVINVNAYYSKKEDKFIAITPSELKEGDVINVTLMPLR